jgi:hypothetical protein
MGAPRHDGASASGADSRQCLKLAHVLAIEVEREAPEQARGAAFGRLPDRPLRDRPPRSGAREQKP